MGWWKTEKMVLCASYGFGLGRVDRIDIKNSFVRNMKHSRGGVNLAIASVFSIYICYNEQNDRTREAL